MWGKLGLNTNRTARLRAMATHWDKWTNWVVVVVVAVAATIVIVAAAALAVVAVAVANINRRGGVLTIHEYYHKMMYAKLIIETVN